MTTTEQNLWRQIEWARDKMRRALGLVEGRDAWATGVITSILHALDYDHPKLKKDAVEAKKFDTDKDPLNLLPTEALRLVSRVLGHGATKYDPWNWKQGLKSSRLYAACLRHLFAWSERQDIDEESKLPHLAHAACCLLFLLEQMGRRPDLDDRYQPAAPKPFNQKLLEHGNE